MECNRRTHLKLASGFHCQTHTLSSRVLWRRASCTMNILKWQEIPGLRGVTFSPACPLPAPAISLVTSILGLENPQSMLLLQRWSNLGSMCLLPPLLLLEPNFLSKGKLPICLLCKWTQERRRVSLLEILQVDVVKKTKNLPKQNVYCSWKYMQMLKLFLMCEHALTSNCIHKEMLCFTKNQLQACCSF